MTMGKGGFSLVHTVFDVVCDLPIEFGDSLRLQRPLPHQMAMLEQINADALRFNQARLDFARFTHGIDAKVDGTSTSYQFPPLSQDKWRFLVLNYSGNNSEAYKFEFVSATASPPLEFRLQIGTTETFGEGARVHWGGRVFADDLMNNVWQVHKLDAEYVEALKFMWTRSTELEENYPWISDAMRMLWDLRFIPSGHVLHILGLFAVIELVVTHNPKDRENADSLNHQVSTKIPLLTARMKSPPNMSAFGEQLAEKTLWKKLYGLRSQIAHGAMPSFEGGEFQVLKRNDLVVEYLQDCARKLVAHCLKEPKLVEDLKQV